MANGQVSMLDLLIEAHVRLERQGPGSPEVIRQALGFLGDPGRFLRIADLGCGTGGQTMILAGHLPGTIVGVDICPDFIKILNENAGNRSLQERVSGIVASIDDLPFQEGEFDLIWSEGVIDCLGFEKGIRYWNGFLKMDGVLGVTCPTWLTDERPAEIEKFWVDAVGGLGTVGENISLLQNAGFALVAAFVLPDACWTDNYFLPREAAEKEMREKYAGNTVAEAFFAGDAKEVELYSKYKRHYGYVFYIGKKLGNCASA